MFSRLHPFPLRVMRAKTALIGASIASVVLLGACGSPAATAPTNAPADAATAAGQQRRKAR
ncbi:MAG: hypothetical protein M1546_14155 [Chloroflexi bacterium]|nr:hypothetical protein [Chloroflexota bacterium]